MPGTASGATVIRRSPIPDFMPVTGSEMITTTIMDVVMKLISSLLYYYYYYCCLQLLLLLLNLEAGSDDMTGELR
jgi:hypothetical protein